MPTALEFLQAILPTAGQYCYTVIVNKQARNYFVNDLPTLAEQILSWDQRLNNTDGAVYHACASYSDQRRTQNSVQWIKSLWLDIDVGEGKTYGQLEEAIDQLAIFVGRYNLPRPTLVVSGVGLHSYWTLQEACDKRTWEPYAQALKQACNEFGLGAGPERTADCASILRPPGTTHRKGTARPVICGPLMPPSPLEAFNVLRPNTSRIVRTRLVGDGRRTRSSSLLADCQIVTSPEPIDFERLRSNCNQFSQFFHRQGNITEPVWYALLGVLGFAYGGDTVAQEWSSGHPKYSFQETEGRLERVKQLSGPTTCSFIRGLNPKGCEGCAFGTSTPLEAGRIRVNEVDREIHLKDNSTEETTPLVDGILPDFPLADHQEYRFVEGRLYHITQSLAGVATKVKLADLPVRISSVHIGEINKEQYYYRFEHYKPHNGWHDVVVRPSEVHGPASMAFLANMGIVVHDPTKFHAYIKDSVDSLNRQRRAEMSYEQFGWKGDKFLYGERLYGPGGDEPAAISPELKFRSQWLRPNPGGSLEGWKRAVDNLMGRGSEGMSLTVLASFASTLMPFFGAHEGGAVINLMTRHSGAGKTTALSGAMTVWSSDPRALELINIDTKVSKAVSIGALCNLPCIYDEFDNKDPEVVREFMEMFTSGRDKMRGTGNSNLQHSAASWRMILLTASNASIQDTIISLGRSEAPALRVLEMPVESSGTLKPSELMDLAKRLYANAGWAGEAFIQYLVQPGVTEWVTDKLTELVDDITETGQFRKEHRFWVRALAAIACAAIIVEELQLISFSTHRIMEWALNHFKQASKAIMSAPENMLGYLSQFINEHLSETLTMPGPADGRRLFTPIGEKPRNAVNIRIEVKGETCYIAQKPLRTWLEKNVGGGYGSLIKEMEKSQVLKEEVISRTLTAGTEIQGGQVKCLSFDIGHPFFTGIMREVKETAKHEDKIRRLTR